MMLNLIFVTLREVFADVDLRCFGMERSKLGETDIYKASAKEIKIDYRF
jgi:hypothetical protein